MKTLNISILIALLVVCAAGLALALSGGGTPLFERHLFDAVASNDGGSDHDGHDHDDDADSGTEENDHADDAGHDGHEGHDHGDAADSSAEEKDHAADEGHDGHKRHGDEAAGGTKSEDHADQEGQHPHEGHDAHEGHDDHGGVSLTQDQMEAFDVRMADVSGGPIAVTIERPAEVVYDENALAHVVPRVAGIVSRVNASEGDRVIEGQVLAVLDSRELADAKATYLASLERLSLAEDNFERAEALIDKRIVSEKTFLTAKIEFAEARIKLRSARQKLLALGINEARIKEITEEADADLTQYIMHAPLSGTVVRRHLSRGESVSTEREAFIVADVSTVWVDISIYSHDRQRVEAGQTVMIVTEGGVDAEGTIAFVTPFVSEETRTAIARVVLANGPMRLRPGMFVTARIAIDETPAKVRVPATALQTHEGQDVVFVRDEEGSLEPRPVSLGRRNGRYAEVVSGLEAGEAVVTDGAFIVKSQLAKSGFDDGHNH